MSDASTESERIASLIAEPFKPNVKIIAASGPNAYLGKYSWCWRKDVWLDLAGTASRIHEHITSLGIASRHISYNVMARLFVDGTANPIQRYSAFLVFVRVPTANERVVVIKAE